MIEIRFKSIENIKNAILTEKNNEKYYKEALKVSKSLMVELEKHLQHLNGSVTFNLAIPHNFFHIIERDDKIKNELVITINNLPQNLKSWVY